MKQKLRIAGVLIIIGIAMMTAGYVFGGKTQHLYMLGELNGIPVLPFGTDSDIDSTVYGRSKHMDIHSGEQTSLPGTAVKHITADVSFGHVTIVPHDKTEIEYVIDNDENLPDERKIVCFVQDETLFVENKKKKKSFRFLPEISWKQKALPRITIYVPLQSHFDTVSVTTGASHTAMEGFTAHTLFLNTGVGETTVINVHAAKTDITAGVGKRTFKNCVFTNLNLKTGVGETCFDGILYGNTVMQTGVGETVLHIREKKEHYRFHIEAGIGEVLIDNVNASRGIPLGAESSGGSGKHLITIQSGIGKVAMTFTNTAENGDSPAVQL